MFRQLLLLSLLLIPAVLYGADEKDAAMPKLSIGDKAPPLAVGEWIQGEPVKEFEKGKIYVLDFWATWCGPCVESIPKLNKLQLENADKGVVVIGMNCLEDEDSNVAAFVKKQGKKLTYRVATDDLTKSEEGKMVDACSPPRPKNTSPWFSW